ncbi:quinone oxidoreductase family protein [Actinosynnema pretiosum]|uniref:NADPH:quinone reductase n=2 Tax=Actinosynnema TaxID=40566 RepID=A0A290Z2L1_9PSEU|nr:zinc-binding dehydrogenase [Actinosynnema pretiosum]ATE53237.1 NADPH:quinone reductase [Actinosynnema pretiosum]
MRAVQITEFGGPEVLTQVELPAPTPEPGELLVEVSRAGVNFADTHQTENSYLTRTVLPVIPGGEVVGTTGDGRRVTGLTRGGGYAQFAIVPEVTAFDVPDSVDDLHALSMVAQGATAWLLLRRTAPMRRGETVVVHAAAGGVGTIAVQLARRWGAGRVIATASSEDKRRLALDLGADVALDSTTEDMAAALKDANDGRGVDVVLDMTGGPTTDASIEALGPFGRLAFYGMANRTEPTPVQLVRLMAKSRTVAGLWLQHAFRLPDRPVHRAVAELFELVAAGELRAVAGGDYGLSEVRRAHEDLLARRTTGKLLLDPNR